MLHVVKLMFIAFFIYLFHACYHNGVYVCLNDTVQLLYTSINIIVEELLVMSFNWSSDSHHCCDDYWSSVYYNGTKQIKCR